MPIKRKGIYYLYVPLQSGGVKLRTTGTGDKLVYRGMKRMLAELKDQRRWKLLDALVKRPARLTLGTLYDSYSYKSLDALEASLSAESLSPHIDGYLARLRSRGRDDDYLGDVERHIRHYLAHGPAATTADLSKPVVTRWLAALTTTPGTRRQFFYSVTGFARYLCEIEVLRVFPFDGMKAPEKNDPRMRYESEANDKRIVDAASPKYRAMLAFIKGTGCDASTPLRTLRRHIDLDRGIAEIQGRKTPHRLVHEGLIEPWALPYLRDYCADKLPSAELWPSGKGKPGKHGRAETPYFTANGVGKQHDEICEALGIDAYTLKDSRHSVAVRMAKAGYSSFEIGEQIGSSEYTVSHVYARFLVKLRRRVTESVTRPENREAQ